MDDDRKLITRWVAEANALRDARRFASAAQAYRRVLDISPDRADLWVQFGNMLKDDGRYSEAQTAYRCALDLADVADTYLQLGRAQKLGGNRELALQSFTSALRLAPESRDVIDEIVSLGQSWNVERETALGLTLSASFAKAIEDLRTAIGMMEAQLPAISRLRAVPTEEYELYRRIYRVPAPPGQLGTTRIGVIALKSAPLAQLLEMLRSIAAQTFANVKAAFPDLAGAAQVAVSRAAAQSPHRFVTASVETAASGAPSLRASLTSALNALRDETWIVVLNEPAFLDREAVAWIASESERSDAIAIYCDEDVAVRSAGGERAHRHPSLRGAFDPELILQGYDFGTALAIRRDVLEIILDGFDSNIPHGEAWFKLCEGVAFSGPVSHVPQALVSRFAELVLRLGACPSIRKSPSPAE
jgi:hypothetical protein